MADSARIAIVAGSEPGIGRATADALGGLDVLINDAGTGHMTPLLDLDFGTCRRLAARLSQ